MRKKSFQRVRDALEQTFPERHLFIRSGGETQGYILSTGKQFGLAVLATVGLTWLAMSTGAVIFMAISSGNGPDKQIMMMKAQSERWVADRQARLDVLMQQNEASSGSLEQLAQTVEKRHGALVQILKDFKGVPGAATALAPGRIDETLPPVERVYAVRAEQERMVSKAETFAKSRAERLRLAFRLAGLNPGAYAGGGTGGPLLESKDSKELAAFLNVDQGFAERIRNAALNLSDMRGLERSVKGMPFARPTYDTRMTSGFGVRFDPFTRRPKNHFGLDFAGPFLTPIHATAPGIVAFAGVRNGYGNCVEIDHGNGFKTRYAHMQSFSVKPGQRVGVGQRVGAMGSTGRSTGVHLHYEVWINGRPQNPARFVKAGDYVQQN
ncbi:peptidoglycan DD-metalloendopeptidase family protein [Asticcacaulis sp. BYS171W]|uniref:Peptidoglycan DD-metalloendopeptidase family protein n=1 Tax=Asticcacaulis aquaticus TaxID=2984212 RepID=A0ABT5HNS3_9CAUL|nr:peptidoglycan DD-metalloendopeptidase family protein [Asticcacaulis aquaticus]MDC7681704.1 peptidoglycan DD-metalloendopeptidase family protein [Asticcacaulis aquaticus]